jgi:manganese-dependent ADP-ribose/CDP-alcohol diphosphatase
MNHGAASPVGLMWNYDEVMAVVWRYNCVKAFFAGHDHKGGHSIDSHGVHYHVLESLRLRWCVLLAPVHLTH